MKIKEPLEGMRKHKLMTQELRKKIPKLCSQEKTNNPMIHAKFFCPYSSYTLYVSEFDGEDIMFGYVTGVDFPEWGCSSLNELAEANRNGLPLFERDRYFTPKRANKISGIKLIK